MEVRSGWQIKTSQVMLGEVGSRELVVGFRQDAVTTGMLVTVTASDFGVVFITAYIG